MRLWVTQPACCTPPGESATQHDGNCTESALARPARDLCEGPVARAGQRCTPPPLRVLRPFSTTVCPPTAAAAHKIAFKGVTHPPRGSTSCKRGGLFARRLLERSSLTRGRQPSLCAACGISEPCGDRPIDRRSPRRAPSRVAPASHLPPLFPRISTTTASEVHPSRIVTTLTLASSTNGMSCAFIPSRFPSGRVVDVHERCESPGPCLASGERYLRLGSCAGQLVAVERHPC
jgi:hypothetical protein